jgi:hypothetical protein
MPSSSDFEDKHLSSDDQQRLERSVHAESCDGLKIDQDLVASDLSMDLSGTSSAKRKHFSARVSNQAGYLCRVHVQAQHDVHPREIFDIFTYPGDQSPIFRDIKSTTDRKVMHEEPGLRVVELTQVNEVKVMWMKQHVSTTMAVTEDYSDPNNLRIRFNMIRSDGLSRFNGDWFIRPVRDMYGNVMGSSFEFTQDVLPKGVPVIMRRAPVLGSMLRGTTLRAVTRLMEDLTSFLGKVRKTGRRASQLLDEANNE